LQYYIEKNSKKERSFYNDLSRMYYKTINR